MLSILIPTYNYNITSIVKELYRQCVECEIEFEILAYDDGSKSVHNLENNLINSLQNCIFIELPNNIGRSAIRNLLAKNAKHNALLFVDAGTFPKTKSFIKTYINNQTDVVNGGMTHSEVAPKKPYKLRWLYTKHREQHALCSSNFLIKKAIFEKHPFDESIKTYGYEDVLFFDALEKNNINILKIDNPVIHTSDDDTTTFILKTESGIKNLILLINKEKLKVDNSKIAKLYGQLEKLKLDGFISFPYKVLRPFLLKNFNSSYPSVFLFDFYKLGYYCTLKNKK